MPARKIKKKKVKKRGDSIDSESSRKASGSPMPLGIGKKRKGSTESGPSLKKSKTTKVLTSS